MNKRIYLDNAASTPVDKRVVEAMQPYWNKVFGNPGGIHLEARMSKEALSNSRKKIAQHLQVEASEIIFTSGGTESNNLAIVGFLNSLEKKGSLLDTHIITSSIEHPSVLEIFKKYKDKGLEVDFVQVLGDGTLDLDDLGKKMKTNTSFVSIMYVNNEIGTIQPIKEISKIIKKINPGAVLHTDASQAPLFLNIRPESLGVDMMTIDAQKIYGPKGVGLLFKKRRLKISPVLIGGGQEDGLRPGTENIPLIVGLAESISIACNEREALFNTITNLRNYLISRIENELPKVILNSPKEKSVPNLVNITVPGKNSEMLTIKLDEAGIACGTRSACLHNGEGSYVLEEISGEVRTGLRFGLGKDTTKKDIDHLLETLKKS